MKHILILALAITVAAPSTATAQDGVIRPRSQTEIPGNRPVDAMRDGKAMQEAAQLLTKAYQFIEKALPVYGGRAHRAKYYTQFALQDLNSSIQYQKPEVSGARPVRPVTANMNERLKKIPAVKDKNRREYPGDLVRTSDTQLNSGGKLLLQARSKIWRIQDKFGGHLNDSRRLLDMAISEIDRAIGGIRGSSRDFELGRDRIGREIDGS